VNRETDLADLYLQAFMDECANAKCNDATAALLGALTGKSGLFGCDMLNILYYGDVKGGYYQGWRDNVTTKAAYLLSLANMGVVLQSAYLTLETNNSSAYQVISSQYDEDVIAAAVRIKKFDDMCKHDWYDNFKINADRICQINADDHLSTQDFSMNTEEELYKINPYRLWLAIVYDGHVSGYENHSMQCYDCYSKLHYDNDTYNILMASMPTDSKANYDAEHSSSIKYEADHCTNA